jgi:hypothetical protein
MTVPWKAWKTKYGFFHASHRPLKIPQNRRDFHIPTAQACTAWKSGKPTTGFPLSHPVHAMTTTVLSLNRKTKRKEVGRYAASSFFMPLSLRSSGTDFMLILQLENANGHQPPAAPFARSPAQHSYRYRRRRSASRALGQIIKCIDASSVFCVHGVRAATRRRGVKLSDL